MQKIQENKNQKAHAFVWPPSPQDTIWMTPYCMGEIKIISIFCALNAELTVISWDKIIKSYINSAALLEVVCWYVDTINVLKNIRSTIYNCDRNEVI